MKPKYQKNRFVGRFGIVFSDGTEDEFYVKTKTSKGKKGYFTKVISLFKKLKQQCGNQHLKVVTIKYGGDFVDDPLFDQLFKDFKQKTIRGAKHLTEQS